MNRKIVLISIVFFGIITLTLYYFILFRECPNKIASDIETLKQNLTSLGGQYGAKKYYDDIKTNISTIIIEQLNEAEKAYNSRRCMDSIKNLDLARYKINIITDHLRLKMKTEKVIDFEFLDCLDGNLFITIKNEGTENITIIRDLIFRLDEKEFLPECVKKRGIIPPGESYVCIEEKKLSIGWHKMEILGPSNNITGRTYCI